MALVEIHWHPDSRQLRQFGFLCLAFLAGLATWARLTDSVLWFELTPDAAPRVSLALWCAAAATGAVAVVAPAALRPLFLLLTVAALPIGFVVSHVVMAFVFFGVITPIALVFRLTGRDALQRACDKDAPTYWVPRPPAPQPERYFRQF